MIQTIPLRTSYPLAIRDKIERLWRMCAFRAPFGSVFQSVFGEEEEEEVETHWWLAPSGGVDTIPAANCVAAYDAKNADSLALSYDNLASALTTYDLTLGVVPTWANGTGWSFNGTSQYLKTGIVPATGWSVMARIANAQVNTSYQVFFGQSTVAGAYWFLGNVGSNLTQTYFGHGSTDQNVAGDSLATGTLGMAGAQAYKNGLPVGTAMGAWTTTATGECYIGAYNLFNWAIVPSSTIIAVAIYNTILSDATMVLLNTAINAL